MASTTPTHLSSMHSHIPTPSSYTQPQWPHNSDSPKRRSGRFWKTRRGGWGRNTWWKSKVCMHPQQQPNTSRFSTYLSSSIPVDNLPEASRQMRSSFKYLAGKTRSVGGERVCFVSKIWSRHCCCSSRLGNGLWGAGMDQPLAGIDSPSDSMGDNETGFSSLNLCPKLFCFSCLVQYILHLSNLSSLSFLISLWISSLNYSQWACNSLDGLVSELEPLSSSELLLTDSSARVENQMICWDWGWGTVNGDASSQNWNLSRSGAGIIVSSETRKTREINFILIWAVWAVRARWVFWLNSQFRVNLNFVTNKGFSTVKNSLTTYWDPGRKGNKVQNCPTSWCFSTEIWVEMDKTCPILDVKVW